MQHAQISHNPDLIKLIEEGYELELTPSFIIVNHIPYITEENSVMYGSIASTYHSNGDKLLLNDHTAYFCGKMFHEIDLTPINSIVNSKCSRTITNELYSSFYLSSKPTNGYRDFYEKFTTYIKIISGPALTLDSEAKIKTFNSFNFSVDSIFKYPDTASSVEGFDDKKTTLEKLKIAIIGVGGTGSYVLDFLSKTRVKEIHLYDGDEFLAHNAYRAPGAPSIKEFQYQENKSFHFETVYSEMRHGIYSHPYYVTSDNIDELCNYDFIFINIDNGASRKIIHEYLIKQKVPFIDNGIGMGINKSGIFGIARTTLFSKDNQFAPNEQIDYSDTGDNVYESNIQVIEFNALNACLAVIRFKQYFAYYTDNVHVDSINFSLIDMETNHAD